MAPLPWPTILRWAAVGTLAVVVAVLWDLGEHGGRNAVSLIQPGTAGPSRDVVAIDFPELTLPTGLGHDGQQFYAMARAPMHLDDVAPSLDRPRYRLQRPLLSWLAWGLHPTGGGTGLIWAMFIVNVAALLVVGVAAGALSVSWHGPAWIAAVVPLVPVGFVSMRISVADALAMALVLAALAADVRDRSHLARITSGLAVLGKESALVVLVAWLLSRRNRDAALMAGVAASVAGAWWLCLRLFVESDTPSVVEFGLPLRGLVDSLQTWSTGKELWAAGTALLTLGLLLWVATRRRRHLLAIPTLLSVAFLIPLNESVIGLNLNATRTLGPVMALSLLALATPGAEH